MDWWYKVIEQKQVETHAYFKACVSRKLEAHVFEINDSHTHHTFLHTDIYLPTIVAKMKTPMR